jgi:hypothetical protein
VNPDAPQHAAVDAGQSPGADVHVPERLAGEVDVLGEPSDEFA